MVSMQRSRRIPNLKIRFPGNTCTYYHSIFLHDKFFLSERDHWDMQVHAQTRRRHAHTTTYLTFTNSPGHTTLYQSTDKPLLCSVPCLVGVIMLVSVPFTAKFAQDYVLVKLAWFQERWHLRLQIINRLIEKCKEFNLMYHYASNTLTLKKHSILQNTTQYSRHREKQAWMEPM